MKRKMAITIIVIFIIIVSIILYNFIANDDDFAPYINKEYDKVYDINSDIYNLVEIKSELTEIAQEYEEGLKLTFIQYDIEESNKKAEFQFYTDNYDGLNKACLLTINVDIDAKKTTKIKYEKGHGKRVKGYYNEISTLEKISDYINLNESIKIKVTSEDITLYKDGQKIEKKDFIKNITNNIEENFYSYHGLITEINSNNIVFENQSSNKKYSIDANSNFKFINARTNEEIKVTDLKVGYYIDVFPYNKSKVIAILSDIKGEELRKELMTNFTLENPLYSTVAPIGTNMEIINKNKVILTVTFGDLLPDYNTDGGEFEMKVEINSNTKIECKGLIVEYVEQLKNVSLDIIKIKLERNTINNEIPIVTYFNSSNGN
ncbi:MAG: hypothetical protein ACI4VH_05315 [Clostridia bacterium]